MVIMCSVPKIRRLAKDSIVIGYKTHRHLNSVVNKIMKGKNRQLYSQQPKLMLHVLRKTQG